MVGVFAQEDVQEGMAGSQGTMDAGARLTGMHEVIRSYGLSPLPM